jgi:tellurite resistance protein
LLTGVDREVAQGIEAVYETARQRVLVQRRAEADLAVQKGKTAILQALSAAHSDQLTAEQQILSKWNERMLEMVDQNRKVDVARAEALAESLARNNAVEVERQHTATRIDQLRADHQARELELEQRVTRIREDAAADQARREAEWQRVLGLANQENAGLNVRTVGLQTQLESLSTVISKQYQDRIATLETVKESYRDELERAGRVSQRMNRTMVILMVLLTVVALALGLIFGLTLGR